MSRTFERSALSTQTPAKIDYSQFYRNLGDLVIEGAYYGDSICETIYKRAWQKTIANMSENNAGPFGYRAGEPPKGDASSNPAKADLHGKEAHT